MATPRPKAQTSSEPTGEEAWLVDVAVPVPLPRALTYRVSDALHAQLSTGSRVVCSVGSRRMVGVVLGMRRGPVTRKTKAIGEVLGGATLPGDLVSFLLKLSSYYLAPIGEVVRLALPPVDREAHESVQQPTLFSSAKGVSTRDRKSVV